MWAIFTEKLQKKTDESPVLKKTLLRIFTLSLALGLLFSPLAYMFFASFFQHNLLAPFILIFVIAVLLGSISSYLIFKNMLTHITLIIHELSKESPKWELLEKEYIESDIRNSYLAIKKLHMTISSQSKMVGVGELASQVAHDIRSPLVALDLLVRQITHLPEDKRIAIRNAINRIHGIANNLLALYKNKNHVPETFGESSSNIYPELISDILMSVLSEKRIQYKDNSIEFNMNIENHSYGMFASVSPLFFIRILSNLINNAVEANAKKIDINLSISTSDKMLLLDIKDNGKGISSDILNVILSGRSVTSKNDGHGLGLTTAIKTIEIEWKGRVHIKNGIQNGTCVSVALPQAQTPSWFLSKLNVDPTKLIVILDDDEFIHKVWDKRFKEINFDFHIKNMNKVNELLTSTDDFLSSVNLFLIDHELLGSSMNGIDVIEKLGIAKKSHLVTSRYDDIDIRQRCVELNLTIIPKTFAPNIPISIKSEAHIDLIFIDDNVLLTSAWTLSGIENNKKIAVYNNIQNFMVDLGKYNFDTPIYIDSDLNEKRTGQSYAHELYLEGYKNIYLATGYPDDSFPEMHWIKKIVGKEPPFMSCG